ncbi:hypothetical protein [Halocatena salina]|uniref:Uncharacterized protein n=1 Tax=Halocatena salina TaxID=2934340 RepID=A0A8U0A647_9EURY|nr:hypothetical protein [Halocatena salina]UPM44651.1 hypothetical protein MW046_16565 [Halocatena salina]
MGTNTSNDSNALRKCVYCGAPAVGQAMRQHIAQTVDDEHGPFQTIPDSFGIDDCPRLD